MEAGEIRDRVTIQEPTPSVGAGGQPLTSWATYATRWARVNTEAMKERMQGDRPEAQTKWKVVLRYDSNVTEAMRIVHDGRTLNIAGLTYDRVKRTMFAICYEER